MGAAAEVAGCWAVPQAWRTHDTLRDGTAVTLRYARPADEAMIRATFATLTPETVYSRFFMVKRTLTRADIARVTHCDDGRTVALLALAQDGAGERLAGGGSYTMTEKGDAELAFLIHQDFQGRGLGTMLLRHLAAIARAHGVRRMRALVLSGNAAMLAVFRDSGLHAVFGAEGETVAVTLTL